MSKVKNRIILSLFVVIGLFWIHPGNIRAEETDTGFVYEISNNEIIIKDYTGNAGKVVIPDEMNGMPVTVIADKAFYGTKIGEVEIGANVKVIEAGAFEFMDNLTVLRFKNSESQLKIRGWAFYGCTNLASLEFGNRPIELSNDCFGRVGVKELTITENITPETGSWDHFTGAVALKKLTYDSPAVGRSMFYACPALEQVVLTDKVKEIRDRAFYACESLKQMEIGNSLETIGEYALSGNSNLETIVLPDSLKSIGKACFSECNKLTELYIPKNVETIDVDAFKTCSMLQRFVVSKDNQAFSACEGILCNKEQTRAIVAPKRIAGKLVLPDGMKVIEADCFYKCTLLEEVTLPETLQAIYARAFKECTTLKKIVIPDHVIGALVSVFDSCTSLETAELGNGITTLSSTFFKCESLKKITMTDSVTTLGSSAFSHCSSLTEITLSQNITEISDWAFYGCSSLKRIQLPTGIKKVGFRSFEYCSSLEELTFSEQLEEVSRIWYAMADNESLQYVFFKGAYVSISDNVFQNMNPDFVVFYREAYPAWSQYTKYPAIPVTKDMETLKDALGALNVKKVTLADKERLEQYQAAYTGLEEQEQKFYLETEIKALKSCLKKVEVLELGKKIEGLPEAEQIKPEDKDEIRSANTAYNQLTDEYKGYITTKQRVKLSRLVIKLEELLRLKGIDLEAADISNGNLCLVVGEKKNIRIRLTPSYAEYSGLKAISNKQDKIANVALSDNRETVTITGIAAGDADITIESQGITDTLKVKVCLQTPKNVKVTQLYDNSAKITWERVAGAKFYKIYRKDGNGQEQEVATHSSVIYTDSGLKAGISYTYWVVACVSKEEEGYNSEKSTAASVRITPPVLEMAQTNMTMYPGDTMLVSAKKAEPAGNTIYKAESSNRNVVDVTLEKNGIRIYAKGAGSAYITVTGATGGSSSVRVTVKSGTIQLNVGSIPLQKGKSTTCVMLKTATPTGNSIKSVVSSNSKIVQAKLTKGKIKITGKKAGTAYVIITGSRGGTAKVKVKVQNKKVTTKSLSLEKKKITLKAGKKCTLKVVRNPLSATDKITFSSSNKKIARVDAKGVVTAKKKGTVKITVKTGNGKKAVCTIKVK